MTNLFKYTCRLVRFILRRERIISTVWIISVALFSIILAPALGEMFGVEEGASILGMLENPAMVAMVGPIYGDDAGALYANFMLLWVIITVGIMNVFFVVRHTRADEEKGRGEVVRSLPTGRLATLNATMISAAIVNLILALVIGFGIAATGVESMNFAGSMMYGIALGVSGLFFAALTAIFCQLSASSRGALGLSVLSLGIIYMLRAAGDMNSDIEFLSYISPMGLIQRSEIFVNNYILPVIIVLILTAVCMVSAFILNSLRDMDRGFIAAKPGRKEASAFLKKSSGLAFRLVRNSIIAWFIGIFLIGAAYGAVLGTDDFNEFVETNEFYGQIMGVGLEYSTEQMFVSMIGFIMAFIAIVPVLTTVLKIRGEEKEGRAEHVLARTVSRSKYMSAYVLYAFISGILMQFATAVGVYIASASVIANSPEKGVTLKFLLEANLVYLPAMWVIMGLAVMLIGFLPKVASAIWGYYALSFFLIFMGRLPDLLPEWVLKITPFSFIPQLPAEEIKLLPLAVLTIIAAVLTIAGFIGFRKRDLTFN